MERHERIREFRRKEGLTQDQLSKLVGCSIGYISQVENAVRKPSVNFLEKIEKIRTYSEKLKINKIVGNPTSNKIGIIVSGVSYLHVLEAEEMSKAKVPVLKLGFFYPLPEKKIKNFSMFF